MDNRKKFWFSKKIIFLYLVVFPFGQLIRFEVFTGSYVFALHPVDIITGVLVFLWAVGNFNWKLVKKGPLVFIFALVFSWLFSLTIFTLPQTLIGLAYLSRLVTYLLFPLVLIRLFDCAREQKLIFKSLITVIFFIGVFGWVQYFLYPDFRPFVVLGWDDHLYRLIGTFFDPGFTAILLVMGAITSLIYFLEKKSFPAVLVFAFLSVTLAFTYSRAGYVAFISALGYIFFLRRKLKQFVMGIVVFAVIIFFLPRPSSSGVQLERLYSVWLRMSNYQETVKIWSTSPVFGVGYNNLCLARQQYFGNTGGISHSCSGSDSSLLLILATSGVVGLLVFFRLLGLLYKVTKSSFYGRVFRACLIAVLVHSLFVNSLFYPWVMGYLGILLGLTLSKATSKSEG